MPTRPKYIGTQEYRLVRQRLLEVAQAREAPIGYGVVFDLMKLKPGNYAAGEAGHLLGELCEHMHLAGKPMLSALVVNQDRKIPGPGFFELAVTLGKLRAGASDEDKRDFWRKELEAVYAADW